MRRHPAGHSKSMGRRGAILVFAMIALLVVTMLGASLMRSAMMSLRQLQREQMNLQATWLADAGCQRALSRLRQDTKYDGEDWTIPADQLKSGAARVRITITTDHESAGQRVVTAIAEYPQKNLQSVRISKRLVLPSQGSD